MLPPPRELVLLARLALPALDDPPKPPPVLRDEVVGTLRLPTLSPPLGRFALPEPRLELEPNPELERFAPVLVAPARFAPVVPAPARLPAVAPPNLFAVFVLAYGAPPR